MRCPLLLAEPALGFYTAGVREKRTDVPEATHETPYSFGSERSSIFTDCRAPITPGWVVEEPRSEGWPARRPVRRQPASC